MTVIDRLRLPMRRQVIGEMHIAALSTSDSHSITNVLDTNPNAEWSIAVFTIPSFHRSGCSKLC